MVERSSVYEVGQIGIQSVSGTGVAATKKLTAMSLDLSVGENTDIFTPQGSKYPTVIVPNREWAAIAVTGKPTYTEILYPLAAFLEVSGPSTVGTLGRKWTFDSHSSSPDATKLFTLEKGSSVRAASAIDTFMKTFGFTISKMRGNAINGEMMGRAITDGITITPGLSALELIPMTPADFSVYIDTGAATNLGNTKMGRLFDYGLKIANKADGEYVLDAATGTTYAAVVETQPTPELTIIVQANAEGMAFLAGYRAQTTYYIRIRGVGPLLELGTNYAFQFDCAARVGAPQKFQNEQGTYAIGFKFVPIHDAVWDKAFTCDVTNKITAL